eukprot:COSAG05_NODE_12726_length_457_cov_0.617318_1_plen_31_part_10
MDQTIHVSRIGIPTGSAAEVFGLGQPARTVD